MFILSSISSSLKFWLVNHTSNCKKFELKVYKNIKVMSEIPINLPRNMLGKIYTNQLNHVDTHCSQYYNELKVLQ